MSSAVLSAPGARSLVTRGFPILMLAAAAAGTGCTGHPLAAPTPAPESEGQRAAAVQVVKKLDLLFLVDDSRSMREEQVSLGRNFPLFMQQLTSAGIANLRVAVISSNFGAGPDGVGSCQGRGDAGRFLVKPNCGLAADGPHFLAVGPSVPGGSNFAGSLPQAFACLADLGTEGCGYEHQLQSLRYALHGPDAQDFLRPDANLGIVLVTDEDDCSGTLDSTLFSEPRPGEEPNLRCATTGHACAGMAVVAAAFGAPLMSCAPQTPPIDEPGKRRHLIGVAEVVDQVRALKAGTGKRVIVSAIFGWDDAPGARYQIAPAQPEGGATVLALSPICQGPHAWAMPAVRLKSFVDAFAADGSWQSICTDDLGPALTKIGAAIASGDPDERCLPAAPVDLDPAQPGIQADCIAEDRSTTPGGTGTTTRHLVPACGSGVAQPCWELTADDRCPGRVRPVIRRVPGTAAEGTVEQLRCATCTGASQPGCGPP